MTNPKQLPAGSTIALITGLFAVTEARAAAAESTLGIQADIVRPEIFQRVELRIGGMPAADNPFDPEVVALDLECRSPTGKQARVPGFFHREFAQYYSHNDSHNEKHPAQMTAEKTARFYARYRKPFFVSEYGTDWKGWKPETDPHFRALHQAI